MMLAILLLLTSAYMSVASPLPSDEILQLENSQDLEKLVPMLGLQHQHDPEFLYRLNMYWPLANKRLSETKWPDLVGHVDVGFRLGFVMIEIGCDHTCKGTRVQIGDLALGAPLDFVEAKWKAPKNLHYTSRFQEPFHFLPFQPVKLSFRWPDKTTTEINVIAPFMTQPSPQEACSPSFYRKMSSQRIVEKSAIDPVGSRPLWSSTSEHGVVPSDTPQPYLLLKSCIDVISIGKLALLFYPTSQLHVPSN